MTLLIKSNFEKYNHNIMVFKRYLILYIVVHLNKKALNQQAHILNAQLLEFTNAQRILNLIV
ncbi:hypothetical protein MTBBW1_1640001 [Desulfamplus magnetovallimortis]|uniref:Uncharacterized protein n=1 Tax=Desulfamplus magnetovallimortis TaxID=1246637 RepID=A0A1W1H931_9BACT|nr:hypothetical protein MTBBW1_1640001 [Desulfamplus magnetovallimortis]